MKKTTIQLNIIQSLKDVKIHSNVVTLLIGQHHNLTVIFAIIGEDNTKLKNLCLILLSLFRQ
jgi:hypothetical protein